MVVTLKRHFGSRNGYVDGQTTNPTLIARNPEVRQLVASGQKLSPQEELEEYKKIGQAISPLVGDAGVSIEVFAEVDTSAEQMLAQGQMVKVLHYMPLRTTRKS